MLATLLYHALRRDELCRLTVKDFKLERRGVAQEIRVDRGTGTRDGARQEDDRQPFERHPREPPRRPP